MNLPNQDRQAFDAVVQAEGPLTGKEVSDLTGLSFQQASDSMMTLFRRGLLYRRKVFSDPEGRGPNWCYSYSPDSRWQSDIPPRQQSVLDYVSEAGRPVGTLIIADALDCSRQTVESALRALYKAGLLERKGSGGGAGRPFQYLYTPSGTCPVAFQGYDPAEWTRLFGVTMHLDRAEWGNVFDRIVAMWGRWCPVVGAGRGFGPKALERAKAAGFTG